LHVIIGIEHVSFASPDAAEVIRFFQEFGLALSYQEDLVQDGIRTCQLDAGNATVEIIEPLRADSSLQRFLDSRGPGIHHVCFRVDNLEATIAQIRAAGLQLVSDEPLVDGQGHRVFVHPRSGHGVLMGLVERHPEPQP
jgi:methylmalonyl-CoA epimerase